MLSEMGVNVVEAEEDAPERTPTSPCARRPRSSRPPKESAFDRTDDPVRMYLREMGSVELLSREGEIAIAKRIEAGRDTMIRGLCESALTFEAIMVWREELAGGRILLREVIDLEQTYGGQVAQALSDEAVAGEQIEAEARPPGDEDDGGGRQAARPASSTIRRRPRWPATHSSSTSSRSSGPIPSSCPHCSPPCSARERPTCAAG